MAQHQTIHSTMVLGRGPRCSGDPDELQRNEPKAIQQFQCSLRHKPMPVAIRTFCLFLSLPTELRDIIYMYSWGFQTIEASISCTPPTSIRAVPKGIVHDRLSKFLPRQQGLPIWLVTCQQMLREGIDSLSREFAFTSSTLSTIGQVKTMEGTDVLNRLVFGAIKRVVLDRIMPSWIQDVDSEMQAEDEEEILPTEVTLAQYSSLCANTAPNEEASLLGVFRVRDQQFLRIMLWPADRAMLNILYEAGTAIRELHMHWVYDVGTIVPGDEPFVRNKTLDKWVGRLERMKITVESEPSWTFAGRMATELVERTAKRLVGEQREYEISITWKEEDVEDGARFVRDECDMQTRSVMVESRNR